VKEINTNLLTYESIEYQIALQEYAEAKEDIGREIPTKDRLKRIIIATTNLAKIRKKMLDNAPQA
jgi:hypothetical protein